MGTISELIGILLLLVRPVHLQHYDQTKSSTNSLINHVILSIQVLFGLNKFLVPLLGIS